MKKTILCAFLITMLFVTAGIAQETKDKLHVVGKASMKTIPEDFTIMIPFNIIDSLYEVCSEKLLDNLNTIQKELIKSGIQADLIKTLSFSISDNIVYKEGGRIKEGYRGNVRLQITDTYTPEMLGTIINVLQTNEALYTLSFTLSEKQKINLKEKAIKNAVTDAKEKARLIADASGVELGRITRISFDHSYYSPDFFAYDDLEMCEEAFYTLENIELSPKEISIDKKVSMEWLIKSGD